MSYQFEFVLEDGPAKPQGADRSLIRRRSMLGRNKRDGSRRSLREKKKLAAVSHQVMECAVIPPAPPIDLALARLASELGSRSQSLLHKLLTNDAAHFSISPLELCVDFDFTQGADFRRLFYDKSFLSAALFVSSTINDLTTPLKRQISQESTYYLRRTLLDLHTKLDRKDAPYHDSTLLVVISLALLSTVFDDWKATSVHMAGLHRVVELCGGLSFLRQRAKFHYKVERLDLSWVLSSGRPPYFSPNPISWEPTFKSRLLSSTASLSMHATNGFGDERLSTVYYDLQYLTVTINQNSHYHVRWKGAAFQEVFSSIQARLLCLMTEIKEPLQEFMCLGMLAFLTTSFKIPGRTVTYPYLAERFRKSCQTMMVSPLNRILGPLELWGLFVGAISVFDVKEEMWLLTRGAAMMRGKDLDWPGVQTMLQSIMWVCCMHDDAGKMVFETMRKATTGENNINSARFLTTRDDRLL